MSGEFEDTLPDLGSMTDQDLKDQIEALTEQER